MGWEVPACIGVKLARPKEQVVGIVGDYSFQFLLGDIATAVQYRVPYVIVMLNNGYLSLIRQPEKYLYEMDYAVDIGYDDGYGPDFVKIMEGFKAVGRRVEKPGEISAALEWAVRESNTKKVPALVEIRVERQTDASMGPSLDKIREFEPTMDEPNEILAVAAGKR